MGRQDALRCEVVFEAKDISGLFDDLGIVDNLTMNSRAPNHKANVGVRNYDLIKQCKSLLHLVGKILRCVVIFLEKMRPGTNFLCSYA